MFTGYHKVYTADERNNDCSWGLYCYRELTCSICNEPLNMYIKHYFFPNPKETELHCCDKHTKLLGLNEPESIH